MTYAELYPSLIERKLITPRDPPAIPTNPQWWYKPELHCVYHSGAPRHDVEKCYPLKTKVQDLVRKGILFFEDVGPNVKKNPLPEHGKSAVNMNFWLRRLWIATPHFGGSLPNKEAGEATVRAANYLRAAKAANPAS
ncbi:hypothetical protein KIW84_071205 [Lathyrus oleraceus]|uniref:Uncharacterized protein n=1 Tax=Pisum sativum TaxID=3888 RepID=A0A9D4VK19_PEA|nr:hypothetical protein KIW84_071205 [Pisum sativum]